MKPLLFHGLIFFPYGILAPLALVGLGFSLKNWRKYLLVYLILFSYVMTLLLFFVCDRYRQPLIPFLIPLAVYGAYQTIGLYKKRDFKNLSLVLFVLVLLLIESNHMVAEIDPIHLQAQNQYLIGNAELERGNLGGAEKAYKKAISIDPRFGGPYNNLGMIAIRRGDVTAASKNFLTAIQLEPHVIEPYLNYSTFLIERQYLNEALEILQRARNIQPLNDFIHLKIGLTLYQLDRKDEALKAIEESLRLNPKNENARQALEQLKLELEN
jgi:tetratricopeptide (TPR) repeat protein